MWDGDAMARGSRPLDYLRRLAVAPRALIIHGNYLVGDEIEFVGQHRDSMSVAFCPRTHAYFGHPTYPLAAMLDAGVCVVLGTDSRASNPDLSLWGEVQFAAARYPAVAPATWVRMATLDGATALGVGDEVGSLTPGKRADFVALRCAPGNDPHLTVTESGGEPIGVWVEGTKGSSGRGAPPSPNLPTEGRGPEGFIDRRLGIS